MITGSIQHFWHHLKGDIPFVTPYAEAHYGFGDSASEVIARYGFLTGRENKPTICYFPDAFPEHINQRSLKQAIKAQLARFPQTADENLSIRFRLYVNSLANHYARIHWTVCNGDNSNTPPHKSDEYPDKLLHMLQEWAKDMLEAESQNRKKDINLSSEQALSLDEHIEFVFRYGALSQWAGSATESPLKHLAAFLALQHPNSSAAFALSFSGKNSRFPRELRINHLDDVNLSCIYKLTQFDHINAHPLKEGANSEEIIMDIFKKLTAHNWSTDILIHKDDTTAASSIRRE